MAPLPHYRQVRGCLSGDRHEIPSVCPALAVQPGCQRSRRCKHYSQGQGATASANAEPYDYSEDLDIAKAVRADSAAASDCGPVQGHVIYVDPRAYATN
ncbi:DUF2790 domain-containing protein [Pseudomonas sp. PCH446]